MERIWQHEKIAYGGDYNPEQWPEEVWKEDMRLFKEARIDIVTLNVFSWAKLQPAEETYDFSQLDKILDMVRENGLKVCLATSTGAHPAWMAKKYPEICRVDNQGLKRKFGGRHNSCPNSPVYRMFSTRLAEKLAERYGKRAEVIGWHISNEFGGECYCENCEKAFRVWLKERYKTIEEVNRAWFTSFWSHTFYDWDEIVLPSRITENFECYGRDRTQFQGMMIDYKRFNSDSMMDCYRLECDSIRKYSEKTPITTNLMGFYEPLDYQKWAEYMDFASWDNYPSPGDSPARTAMTHDLIRGLKGGKSFCLMEQTPSVTNWQPFNKLKRPGEMRLISYQAVAHGSDTIMFFQMRRGIGACEKYHGAVIDHAGRSDTRVFREITTLGKELDTLGSQTLGGRTPAKAAILFDWNNWWGIEYSAGPSILIDYREECFKYYQALHKNNIPVDVIGVSEDLSKYDLVIAPILYMVKPGVDEKLRQFVKNGGRFVTTYFSGYVGESDLVMGAYPGNLSDILGIWVEESDALFEDEANVMMYKGKKYPARILCDIIHLETAEALSTYEEDFYAGTPVITENLFGAGKAYYVGTSSDEAFYDAFLSEIAEEMGLGGIFNSQYENVEFTERCNENGSFVFILNHNKDAVSVKAEGEFLDVLTNTIYRDGDAIILSARDVKILKRLG